MNALRSLWFWLVTPVLCSWCGRVKHNAPLGWLGDGVASHGVCSACAKKFIDDLHTINQ
jgi:hypothetical protein